MLQMSWSGFRTGTIACDREVSHEMDLEGYVVLPSAKEYDYVNGSMLACVNASAQQSADVVCSRMDDSSPSVSGAFLSGTIHLVRL